MVCLSLVAFARKSEGECGGREKGKVRLTARVKAGAKVGCGCSGTRKAGAVIGRLAQNV